MTDRNIVEMVEEIRKKAGGTNTSGVDATFMAKVDSVSPLTLRLHNVPVAQNIYINPALILEASDDGEKIKQIFQNPFETPEAYEFLKAFHEKFVIQKGDTVIVHIAGSSFYVAGKAVAV